MKVGIYGGSFNPIHFGHTGLAKWVLEHTDLDEVWLMVSPNNPLKDKSILADEQERLEKAREAIGDEALAIFIAPPSVEELSRRLHGRGDTSEEMIQKRLAKAEIEMADAPYFDHIVVNDDLTKAKHALDKLVR